VVVTALRVCARRGCDRFVERDATLARQFCARHEADHRSKLVAEAGRAERDVEPDVEEAAVEPWIEVWE